MNDSGATALYPWLEHYPADVDWHAAIEPRPVFAMLDDTAAQYPANPAFDFLGRKYSWADIAEQVNRFAKGLQQDGVKKGMKVGLFLPNSPIFLIAYYAVLKAGGTLVNFNPLYAQSELAHQIEDSETDIMITFDLEMLYAKMDKMLHNTRLRKLIVARFTDTLPFPKQKLFKMFRSKELAQVKIGKRIAWFDDYLDNDGQPAAVEIDPRKDIALLQYTGGTTGVPKGAMLTHYNIYANTVQSLRWFADVKRGEQRMLGVLPFFHVFAMTAIMNLSVLAALEIIALPRFNLAETLKVIDKKKPHLFPAVPAIYNAINNSPKTKKYDLSSLLYCISGGAPLPVEVKKSFEEKTGCVVVEGYGLSESSPVACVNPLKGDNVPGSIGLPVCGTIIELIDPADRKTHVAAGERGELCIRGPQVMAGYWKNEEATKDALVDGRLHTGDIAVMDSRGYVFIVDRIKDMIITNGYNVYPRNIEEAIYKHPSVEECVVAGLLDKQRGEIVKTWIKLKEGRELTAEDLKVFLEDKLSPMEMPKRIEFRKEPLPKTMIGKLSRKDLLEQELAGKG